MKGLWLLPTRRRFDKLQRFFDSAVANNMTTAGVCLVQKDEFDSCAESYDKIRIPKNWAILATNGEGLADKCREVWPVYQKFDWVGLACDDLRPQTHNWDMELLTHVTGKNIVTCNDGQQGSLRMSGITIFSGPVLRAMGYMFPQNFWHTYTDNAWEDIGRGANCWTYVDSVLIKHDHPFRDGKLDPELSDETSNKSYGQPQRDQQAYAQWCATDRAACIERVKALQTANESGAYSGAGGSDENYRAMGA